MILHVLCVCEVVFPEGAPEPMGCQIKSQVKAVKGIHLSLGCSHGIISAHRSQAREVSKLNRNLEVSLKRRSVMFGMGGDQRSVGALERSWKEWATPPPSPHDL